MDDRTPFYLEGCLVWTDAFKLLKEPHYPPLSANTMTDSLQCTKSLIANLNAIKIENQASVLGGWVTPEHVSTTLTTKATFFTRKTSISLQSENYTTNYFDKNCLDHELYHMLKIIGYDRLDTGNFGLMTLEDSINPCPEKTFPFEASSPMV